MHQYTEYTYLYFHLEFLIFLIYTFSIFNLLLTFKYHFLFPFLKFNYIYIYNLIIFLILLLCYFKFFILNFILNIVSFLLKITFFPSQKLYLNIQTFVINLNLCKPHPRLMNTILTWKIQTKIIIKETKKHTKFRQKHWRIKHCKIHLYLSGTWG